MTGRVRIHTRIRCSRSVASENAQLQSLLAGGGRDRMGCEVMQDEGYGAVTGSVRPPLLPRQA